jgi:signal peptidase I
VKQRKSWRKTKHTARWNEKKTFRSTNLKETVHVLIVFLFIFCMIAIPRGQSVDASSNDFTYLKMVAASMHPTLEVGDTLVVDTNVNTSQMYAAQYPEGDIVAFQAVGGEIIVRRVIERIVNNGSVYYVTKGDANALPGPFSPTPAESIVGKVVAFSRDFSCGTWNNQAYNVTVLTNSSLANFNFTQPQKEVDFDVTGYISHADQGFCNVTIPNTMLRCDSLSSWRVLLNGTSIAYEANENDTHAFVYFSYGYSNSSIRIIGQQAVPEFSPLIIPPSFMITMLVALIAYRKKHAKQRVQQLKPR